MDLETLLLSLRYRPCGATESLQPSARCAVAVLEAHRKLQAAEKLAAGPAWREHGLHLSNALGTPERGDNVLKRSLKPLAAEIGYDSLDFRKLRRSHSTFYAVLNVHPVWRR